MTNSLVNFGLRRMTQAEIYVKVVGVTFLTHHVEALLPLLMRTFTRRYCIPFRNVRTKSKGSQFHVYKKPPKLTGYNSNVLRATARIMSI